MSRKLAIACTMGLSAAILFNSCKSYDIAPRYTSKYINSNANKVTAQVPESYELGYVVLALTDIGQRDSNLINKETPYYKEVVSYFSKYKNHKAVAQLNKDLNEDFARFQNYRNGLFAFKINDNRFVLKTDYRIDLNRVNFKRYALLLQSFYRESNFHGFYTNHAGVYDRLIGLAGKQIDMQSAQKMTRKGSINNYQSYHVVMSPLMKGYTGTLAINSHRFNECIIFPNATTDNIQYSSNAKLSTSKLRNR